MTTVSGEGMPSSSREGRWVNPRLHKFVFLRRRVKTEVIERESVHSGCLSPARLQVVRLRSEWPEDRARNLALEGRSTFGSCLPHEREGTLPCGGLAVGMPKGATAARLRVPRRTDPACSFRGPAWSRRRRPPRARGGAYDGRELPAPTREAIGSDRDVPSP